VASVIQVTQLTPPQPQTALESLDRRRFLISAWPWRSLSYVLTALPVTFVVAVALDLVILPWARLIRSGPGQVRAPGLLVFLIVSGTALLLAAGPLAARTLARVERRRLSLVDLRPVLPGHRQLPSNGTWQQVRARYSDPATWREFGYGLVLGITGPFVYGAVLLALLILAAIIIGPLLARGQLSLALGPVRVRSPHEAWLYSLYGLLVLPVVPYVLALLAGAHAALARWLLTGAPGHQLRAELAEVSRSRARLTDAFEAERQRIERDLHDGAQQRLVSMTMQLGLAKLDLPAGSPAAGALAEAHGQAKQLMTDLRELISGIHPRVLADLGLTAAIGELADLSPVPVTVHAALSGRLPSQVETAAYFVVAEALTNVAKHSHAASASVTAGQRGGLLMVEVSDDGRGGADPGAGTGLTGLADRVAVAGGTLKLSSPAGGPTILRAELPCGQTQPAPR
jgi:signal transduction histidine kinase